MTFDQAFGGTADGVGRPAGGYAERGERTVDLAALFRDHHLSLVRLAVLLVGDQASAEDVVHDVYSRLQRRRRSSGAPDDLLAYARACVLNACRNMLRRRMLMHRFAEPPPPRWSAENDVRPGAERRYRATTARPDVLSRRCPHRAE